MSLDGLPDEALAHIFSFVEPRDLLQNVLRLSRRLSRVACEPLMWRRHCISDFRYWHADHHLKAKLREKPAATDWKALYLERLRKNVRAREMLEELVLTGSAFQPSTIAAQRLKELVCLGYDVKDFLLAEHERHLNYPYVPGAVQDFSLATRYWTMATVKGIHRDIAVSQWISLLEQPDQPWNGDPLSLDAALASVGMFLLEDGPGDIDDVSTYLDELARDFTTFAGPDFSSRSTRKKALMLVKWVRQKKLAGMYESPGTNYHKIEHCLLNTALFGKRRNNSIPVISASIFVCIGRRLGLDAHCAMLPGHVLALVRPPAGEDLDGRPRDMTTSGNIRMALDPYFNAKEVSGRELRARLHQFVEDVPFLDETNLLAPASTRQVLLRVFHNLGRSRARRSTSWLNSDLTHIAKDWSLLIGWGRLFLDAEDIHDWMVSAIRYFGSYERFTLTNMTLVDRLLDEFYMRYCRENGDHGDLLVHLTHRTLWEWKRTPEIGYRQRKEARFRNGQIVRHDRFGSFGIVFEWGVEKWSGNEDGRVYYGCLLSDGRVARWLEDGIMLWQDPNVMPDIPPEWLGAYFQRWDRESCSFVPNTEGNRNPFQRLLETNRWYTEGQHDE